MSDDAMSPPSAFVYIPLADNSDVISILRELQAAMPEDGIEWQPVPTLHVTLLFAPSVDDLALMNISRSFYIPESMAFKFAGLGIFENGSERALHIKLEPSDELLMLQRRIFEEFFERGIDLSPYSKPLDWQAHVTLAYLPSGVVPPSELMELAGQGSFGFADKIVIGRDDYQPMIELSAPIIKAINRAWVFKQADSPLRLMLIVTANAYIDREQEIVSEKALTAYVESCWQGTTFVGDNVHLLWHEGDPIGDIIYADMEGPFLIEVSRERPNAPVNIARRGEEALLTTIKEAWDALEIAADLAASHRFFYDKTDREDKVYEMIVKTETSTLPRWAAANLITLSEIVKGGQ